MNNKVYNKRFLLGDIHSHWDVILHRLNDYEEMDVCYIQVGDFGVGFKDIEIELKNLLILNSELKKYNSDLYVLRGNHDNPFWFIDKNFKEIKDQLTNILFIEDYTILNIGSENILFIGGAISIDRVSRRKNFTGWWKEEVVNFDYDFATKVKNIDRIVCHTSPDFCQPLTHGEIVFEFAEKDKTLLSELKVERKNMTRLITEILENNKVKGFYYGHFHQNYRFYDNGCEFVGIGVDTFIGL